MTEMEKAMLEGLIDRDGLAAVVRALEDICKLKADRPHSDWQDSRSARPWERNALCLEQCASRLERR
jgi:hypothetical protein